MCTKQQLKVKVFIKKHNADWFNDNEEEIKSAIEQRNNALRVKLSNPTTEKLREARAKLQRDMRRMVAKQVGRLTESSR